MTKYEPALSKHATKGSKAKPANHGRTEIIIATEAERARIRSRQRWRAVRRFFWFCLFVIAPWCGASWYLFFVAADHYQSRTAFAVRSLEEGVAISGVDLFGMSADSTTGDSYLLFTYLKSQPLVELVDREIGLENVYHRPDLEPLLSLWSDASIEDKVFYWNLANKITYDSSSGIIEINIHAFTPEDARAIARLVERKSAELTNHLSQNARADSISYALADLEEAEERVRAARLAIQDFRTSERTTDIALDINALSALVANLKQQRAKTSAELESRREVLGPSSPNVLLIERRLAALDHQIAQEEGKIANDSQLHSTTPEGTLADAAGRQEALEVERLFAENMYAAAQAQLENARAEARRAQRYLATAIAPTIPQEANSPVRWAWSLSIFILLMLLWMICKLVLGNIRDRH